MKQETIIEALQKVVDPEIGIDIYTLGLIYKIEEKEDIVNITMTFTSPMCPYGPMLMQEIVEQLTAAGAKDVDITITFDPPWIPSPELREMLGV